MMRSMRVAGLVVAGGLALAACGSSTTDDAATDTTSGEVDTTSGEAVAEGVTIDGVWARTSPAGVDAGAAYMTLSSASDDELVSASVDPSIAGRVEIHEVVMADDAMTDSSMAEGDDAMTDTSMAEGDDAMTDTSMAEGDHSMEDSMVMQQIESLVLPAGETVALAPGGYHIMLLELAAPLVEGESFELTLEFKNAGSMTITVPVQNEAP